MKDVFIAGYVRTPVGAFNGSLSGIPAPALGSMVTGEAVKRAGLDAADIEEVVFGNIFSAGLGPMPARQAAVGAGLPASVRASLVNCGLVSGLGSVITAARAISSGDVDVAVAGGMENLSRVPYLVEKARFGLRLGNSELTDPIMKDCLWDERNDCHVASGVENMARRLKISRSEQDAYARRSYSRALEANREGRLDAEIMQLTIPIGRDKFASLNSDEGPQRFDPDGLASSPPLLQDGALTIANSSFLADGAAAFVLASGTAVKRLGLKPVARIAGYFVDGVAAEMFSIASVGAIEGLLSKTGFEKKDIGAYEINEDFSASMIAVIRQAGLDDSRVNVNGGAVAMGTPGGAAGSRLLASLITVMKTTGAARGVAAIGTPGGEGASVLLEAAVE